MAKKTRNPILTAALAYLAMRWAVIPAARRSKHPMVPWKKYQQAPPDETQVRKWFASDPDLNLAVVTGAVSGIVVLDIDPHHGGERSLRELEKRHGSLPETVEVKTGGGGRHIYFAHSGFETRNRAGLAPGIDLRGDGGVIIVPPSIHPSGNSYAWRKNHAPEEISLASLPIWLLEPRHGVNDSSGHSLDYWQALVRSDVEEGRRNATIASFTGYLLWHGVDPDVVIELMLAWNRMKCRPPLGDDEVIRTVHSIERTHKRGNAEEITYKP